MSGLATVVIPCHTMRRWPRLVAAVRSALTQDPAPDRVVVVVDHNEELYARARDELRDVTVLRNAFDRGVSGNRNTGARHARTPVIAMLDDDTFAHPGWLAGLLAPFDDPGVVGTGGGTRPTWQSGQPGWFPDEFLWVVGGSYPGRPRQTAPVRNVWSANMAVRREVFEAVGGFRVGFGKVGDRARPEDTDLCLRMSRASGGRWVYVPDAVVDHPVPGGRVTFRGFLHRCYDEGRGKIELARLSRRAGVDSLHVEREYLRRTLPRAVGRGLLAAVRRADGAAAARAGTVLAGVGAAALGGAVESVRALGSRGNAPAPVAEAEAA